MHDRLKRTARKRGNRLRAKPIIERHMRRNGIAGIADGIIYAANALVPIMDGDPRDNFRLSGPVDETVTPEHAGYGRLAEALTYDFAGRRQALTAWQAARREQRRTSGMDPADPG